MLLSCYKHKMILQNGTTDYDGINNIRCVF